MQTALGERQLTAAISCESAARDLARHEDINSFRPIHTQEPVELMRQLEFRDQQEQPVRVAAKSLTE